MTVTCQGRLRISGLFVLVALTAHIPDAADAQVRFGTDRRINDNPPGVGWRSTESSGQRGLAAVGDSLYLVWGDQRGGVYFARSADGGLTFGPNLPVNDLNAGWLPSIATLPGGQIITVWQDSRDHEINRRIYIDRSMDGGRTFGVDRAISTTFPAGTTQWDPCLATDPRNGNIYVAWFDTRYFTGAIVCARSIDGGMTFAPPVVLTGVSTIPRKPAVAVGPSGDVYVAWHEHNLGGDEIWVATSRTFGATFGPSRFVGIGTVVSLAVAPTGEVYVAALWGGGGPLVLWFARSADAGATFTVPITVANAAGAPPSLAVGSTGQVFVAGVAATGEIRIWPSNDRGLSFGTGFIVNDVPAGVGLPTVAVTRAGRPAVAWTDTRYRAPETDASDIFIDGGSAVRGAPGLAMVPELGTSMPRGLVVLGPNPFRENIAVQVAHDTGSASSWRAIVVLDARGRTVRRLAVAMGGSAGSVLAWNGMDDHGRRVPPGVYFLTLDEGGQRWTERVVRLQ